MSEPPPLALTVLDFWFGPPGSATEGRARPEWFRKDDAFDAVIRERFGTLVDRAIAGELGDWTATPRGTLALIVVLDQFPRNIHRGTPAAFAGDPRALSLARGLVAAGGDRALRPIERTFAYLPFEHAESLADQHEAVRLFATLKDDPDAGGMLEWAEKHRDVIVRFGRFPHRNEILGRPSTPEEVAFLAQPGSRF